MAIFAPLSSIVPFRTADSGNKSIIDRAVIVLPDPDSPTRPTTSLLPIEKSIPSTAFTILEINNNKLGVVVHILSQGLKVPIKKLKECK